MRFRSGLIGLGVVVSVCLTSLAWGQATGSVTLDHIASMRGNSVAVGHNTFYFRYQFEAASSEDQVVAFYCPYVLSSPNGATWSGLSGTDMNGGACAPYQNFIQTRSADGISKDTVIDHVVDFNPMEGCSFGIAPAGNFDTVRFRIDIDVPIQSLGKTICIDTSLNYPPSGGWTWGTVESSLVPSWDGPYCFTVEDCCTGSRGNVNNMMGVTIQDVTYMVAYLFLNGPAPVCPSSGDTNGDGKVTNPDLTRMVSTLFGGNHLIASCE